MATKAKTDPVKDFQKQCVDQRIDLFYVANRIKTISSESKNEIHIYSKRRWTG